MPKFDAVIVGGGMMGLLCALQLQKHDFQVAIIDKNPQPVFQTEIIPNRVIAISPKTKKLLMQVNVWQHIKTISSYDNMEVWSETGSGAINFNAQDAHTDYIGYIVEVNDLLAALWQAIEAVGFSHFYANHTCQEIIKNNQSITLVTTHNTANQVQEPVTFEAKLLIAADGAHSWIRRALSWSVKEEPYPHHALTATVHIERAHQKSAWQCFLKTGPVAFLPLKDPHHCSIVWSNSPHTIDALMQLSPIDFCKALSKAVGNQFGSITLKTPLQRFPLIMRHAKDYQKERVALVGDAAHTWHPMAGQGANLGFLDVSALTNTLIWAQKKGRDIGKCDTLAAYQRQRRANNELMIRLLQCFVHLFGLNDGVPLQLRNLGMRALTRFTPIKKCILAYAIGS